MRWPNWWAKPDCDAMPSESHTMNFIKLFFAALCTAWLLAACAVSDGLPKPQTLPALTAGDTRWFKLEALDEAGNIEQASLLAVQRDGEKLRFVQTDALGAPLSRQTVGGKGWANDGFVAPNADSRRLFAALLPLLDEGAAVYPQQRQEKQGAATVYFENMRELWRSEVSDGLYIIAFPDGRRWLLTPLNNE